MTRSVSVTTAVRVTGADDQIAFPVTGFEEFLDIGRTVTDGSGCHRVGCVLPVHSGCVASAACGGAVATARSRRPGPEHRTARNRPDRWSPRTPAKGNPRYGDRLLRRGETIPSPAAGSQPRPAADR